MNKVLLIDDDIELIQSMKIILSESGYEVFSATNGRAALELCAKSSPDLILCDLVMPGMDGYQVCEHLQKNTTFSQTPFVFLSGLSKSEQVRKGMILGADDYLIKPVTPKNLLDTVNARITKSISAKKRYVNELEAAIRIFADILITLSKSRGGIIQDSNLITECIQFAITNIKNNITYNQQATPAFPATLFSLTLKSKNVNRMVSASNIMYIHAHSDYTKVYYDDNQALFIRKTLNKWMSELPNSQFVQVHRSTIINLSYLERIVVLEKRHINLYIKNRPEPIAVSVRQIPRLKRIFKDLLIVSGKQDACGSIVSGKQDACGSVG